MKIVTQIIFSSLLLGAFIVNATLSAHCDAWDGPVVTEARLAFANGDVTSLLKWVEAEHEQSIRSAFSQAADVAKHGVNAQMLAEQWFLETLVRLHREGEGAPYSGLKPAGSIDKAVALADDALIKGSVDGLADKIGEAVSRGIRERFAAAAELRLHSADSIEEGRSYVQSYVEYVHFVEAIHGIVAGSAPHAH